MEQGAVLIYLRAAYDAPMAGRPSTSTKAKLPDDVVSEQLWRAPDGQHYRVAAVTNGVAALQRATAAGRVLNQRHRSRAMVDKMQAEWTLVSEGP